MCRRLMYLLLAAVFALSCSPAKPETAKTRERVPRYVLLAPLPESPGLVKHRADYFEDALRSGLRTRGYAVLDGELTRRLCQPDSCENLVSFAGQYGLQGRFVFTLEKAGGTNLLLAYSNRLIGRLDLYDLQDNQILSIEDKQRQRSGPLIESDQLIEAVASHYRNRSDENFNSLVDRFVRSIVLKLPKPGGDEGISRLKIQRVDVNETKGRIEICAYGTPGNQASLRFSPGVSTNLREVSPGKYCSLFSPGVSADKISAELRSPFSERSEESFSLGSHAACSLIGKVTVRSEKKQDTITICPDGACCPGAKFEIYEAPNPAGPFKKVGVTDKRTWQRTKRTKSAPRYYSVAAVIDNRHSDVERARLESGESR